MLFLLLQRLRTCLSFCFSSYFHLRQRLQETGSVWRRHEITVKLVRINLVFTRDLVDPVRIGSAIWYQMGPLMKVILWGTLLFQFETSPVWTEWIRSQTDLTYPIPCKRSLNYTLADCFWSLGFFYCVLWNFLKCFRVIAWPNFI